YKYATEILEMAYMVCCNRCRTPVDTESKLGADGDRVSDPIVYQSLATLKRILRFVRDADWVGFPITHKSTSGHCVLLGNNLLSWPSKRQLTLSQSSAKAEELWQGLDMHNVFIHGRPWAIMDKIEGNLHNRVVKLRHEMDEVQKALDKNPSSIILREEETTYVTTYTHTNLDEERFLKQRAKIKWLQEGDSKSAYFHRSVKARISKGRIDCIMDHENVVYGGDDLPKVFVEHYMNFLGVQATVEDLNHHGLFVRKLHQSKFENMVRILFDEEIRMAMFFIWNDKAPGPDGYTTVFFKKAWDVVGSDVCNSVRYFFTNGKLLREVNHTILAMLPKVSTPSRANEFCPISGCNVIYKCISKIITNRIKEGLDDVVSVNQSTFVPGRSISENILLTQELMHTYHLYRGPPRCAFKIDIQKAYDTANWKVLEDILVGFRFHMIMVRWIMSCISGSSFSININGNLHGYFKGRRGLRQGDPMCIKQQIVNICFADGHSMFARGDMQSARVLMEALEEFKGVSGLVPSITKSTIFFCNVPGQDFVQGL
ncbi:putative RNA-directed DNA polymerase, partial [Tanacetum coccineum]